MISTFFELRFRTYSILSKIAKNFPKFRSPLFLRKRSKPPSLPFFGIWRLVNTFQIKWWIDDSARLICLISNDFCFFHVRCVLPLFFFSSEKERVFKRLCCREASLVLVRVFTCYVLCVCVRGRKRESKPLAGDFFIFYFFLSSCLLAHWSKERLDLEWLGCRLVLLWVSFHVSSKHNLPLIFES